MSGQKESRKPRNRKLHAVRIDAELLRKVEKAAAQSRRSVPQQLEYWAELGGAVELDLSQRDVNDLKDQTARVRVEREEVKAIG